MTTNAECARCADLMLELKRAEDARLIAAKRFEARRNVTEAAAAAVEYRDASDAVNQAYSELSLHRKTHL